MNRKMLVATLFIIMNCAFLARAHALRPQSCSVTANTSELKAERYPTQITGYSLHDIEWVYEGHVENFLAIASEDNAKATLTNQIKQDTIRELQLHEDDLGNPLELLSVNVELINWQLSEGSDIGLWDTDYKVTAEVKGTFKDPEPTLALGAIATAIIWIFIAALPNIIKALLIILVILTITYFIQTIRDLFIGREHYIKYDEEGNIIEEGERDIQLWQPWEVPILLLVGGGSIIALAYLYVNYKKERKKK